MKLHFFGTCAGTEPMPGRKHTSFAIEKDGEVYWFDAGEGCSYTAHLMGVDLLSVHNIFISHTHMDHVGGLGNLLWNIRKISLRTGRMSGKQINVFIPNKATFDGIMQLLSNTEGNFKCDFTIVRKDIEDGELYNQNDFKVTALHNNHIKREEGGPWLSFSFLIEAEGKKIVYSGDVASIKDLDPFIENCDLLLMETGHHKVEDICSYIKEFNKKVGTLGFIHHGKPLRENPELELQKAKAILGDRVFMTEDGMTMEI